MLKKLPFLTLFVTAMHTSCLMGETYRVPATSETVNLGLFSLNQPPR